MRLRARRLRAAMAKQSCDALLITNPNDIRYLTGFCGEDSYAVVAARSVTILSDFRFEEELEAARGVARVHIRKGDMLAAVREVVGDLAPRRLALQAEHLTVAQRAAVAKAVGGRRLKDTTGLLRDLRLIKDQHEVALIRRAVKIQQDALRATLPTIRPGQTEGEVAGRLEYEMTRRGAEGLSFQSIVAAGANGSRPHNRPGAAKVKRGGTLLIDWGARVGGYCADMTRTIALGRWPRALERVYGAVLEAQRAAVAAVAPGVRCREVDGAARRVLTKAGYGERFGHGVGHGLGLDVHEGPRLSRTSDDTLRTGMVVTIEPGVYLPGVGGVRIEDDVLVTERGGENLCSLPKDIGWSTR